MVDIKKDFGDSINLLKKNKKIVLPILLSLIITLFLIYLFLSLSGLLPLLKELISLDKEFEKQKMEYLTAKENIGRENYTMELVSYLGKSSEKSKYNSDFAAYLKQRGYDWGRFKVLLNMKNITLLALFLLVSFIISLYLSSMYFAAIAIAIKKEEMSIGNMLRKANSFVLRLLSLKIIMWALVIAPLIICSLNMGLFAALSPQNKALLILLVVLFILLFVAYIIYLSIKLFFAVPSIYIEKEGAFASIKRSFSMTKNNLKYVVLVFLLVYCINYFIGTFMSQPLFETYINFILGSGIITKSVNFLLVILFLAIESVALAFTHIFRFYAYLDFKKA